MLSIAGDEFHIDSRSDAEQAFIELDTDYLARLQADDFLSIRIFLNHDAANTLWQFGFSTLDIDIDSDNNNGLGMPDRSPEEELVENTPGQPGKILLPNTGDANDNGIPDFADFTAGAGFAPMVVEVPEEVDVNTALLRFSYEQSDPNSISVTTQAGKESYIPAEGIMRLWRRNGTEDRDTNDISAGGDFIRSGVAYAVRDFGIRPDKRTAVVYIELVRSRDDWGGAIIKTELIMP